MDKKIKVLFIDDEEHNLHAFKAAFRFDYDVAIVPSANEAEAYLEQNSVHVILCDQRMPGKTGIEFFGSIIKKFPKPVRILITGYADIESVIKAINLGHVYRYINKPWNNIEIQSAIEDSYRYYMQSEELENKISELSRAYKELDNFAYSVSHDMKGPLMSIMGAMNIVNTAENKNDKTVLMMLNLIEKSSIQLSDFVENMHVYYKNNRGQLKIDNVDLNVIKTEIDSLFGLKCLQDNVKLTIDISSNNSLFRTDVTKLRVVANNLVSNALKYQRPDEKDKFVHLNMYIINDTLTMEVKDNGMGVDEKYQKSIFELFFRANSEVNGSGFGLYNVKEIIAKLGGTIELESKLNIGSTFTVKIPSK
ncbi:MAG: hybrid sensor histidine kinase/response regulator [Bacteroidia bacterium]|nr:hybrid sensor histidine kinase/response regulator [Bacteroidia bacterium]MCZ2141582.1 hybrid sensor histidine kinase/response regulator [Bacteroidia bacterium]